MSSKDILEVLKNTETARIREEDPFTVLLDALLSITQSKMGYIAKIIRSPNNVSKSNPFGRFLHCTAIHPKPKNEEDIETLFKNPNAIFNMFYTTSTSIINTTDFDSWMKINYVCDSRWPTNDARIKSLYVIPLMQGETIIGQLGLANRDDVYTPELLQNIEPLVLRTTSLILSELTREGYESIVAEQAVSQTKNIVLANISHEVRTPLNTILGMNALLLETEIDDNQYECLLVQRKSCYHLLGLITDILDINKLEAGKMILKYSPLNIQELVETSYDLIGFDAKRRGLKISFKIDPKVPDTVVGDKQRLKQMLGNLLSNAVKFTDKGSIETYVEIATSSDIKSHNLKPLSVLEETHLSSRKKSDPIVLYDDKLTGEYQYIKFSVKDTGIGIRKEDISRLFKSYEQLDNSNTKRGKGTGLGLAITHELCSLMHGTIYVNSNYGKGSIFTFIIPLKTYNEPKKELDLSILKGKKFLVVDDNDKNLTMLTNILDSWGVDYTECTSSQRALAWVNKPTSKYDLGLLDIIMPNMDGNTLAERISRSDKPFPLIALSSDDEEYSISNFFSYQLLKPYREQQLLEAIIHTLKLAKVNSTRNSKGSDEPEKSGDSSDERHKRPISISSDSESDDELDEQIYRNKSLRSPASDRKLLSSSFEKEGKKVISRKTSLNLALVDEHKAELKHPVRGDSTRKVLLQKTPKQMDIMKRITHDNYYEHATNVDINILVVEDQEFNAIMLVKMLKNIGYHNIDLASSGPEAVAMVKKNRGVPLMKGVKSQYDLILMDIIMPGKYDGVMASKKITKLFRNIDERPKIVAVTASLFDGVVDQYMTDGQMDGFITKPIDRIQCITKVLRNIGFV